MLHGMLMHDCKVLTGSSLKFYMLFWHNSRRLKSFKNILLNYSSANFLILKTVVHFSEFSPCVWLDLEMRSKEILTDQLMGWDTFWTWKPESGIFTQYKDPSGDCFNYSTREYDMMQEENC